MTVDRRNAADARACHAADTQQASDGGRPQPVMPMPATPSRPAIRLALTLAVATLPASAGLAASGGGAPTLSAATLEALTDDLLALTDGAEAPGRAAARAELAALDAALGGMDPTLQPLPAALAQGAALARRAAHPASRAVFADLTRDMLATALRETGAEDAGLLAAWTRRDPMLAELVPGQGLSADDLEAGRRLAALDPETGRVTVQAFWDAQADEPVNRVLPTRMDAWTAGVLAAWDRLDPAARGLAVGVLDHSAVPPPALLEAVIGTADVLGWLGAVDVPLTPAERAASPELVAYMQAGAFAGPVRPLLEALAEAMVAAGAGAGAGEAADQLMRLNTWSAMTGEMHSWDAYRYMTQGY